MKPYHLHLVQFLNPRDHVERTNFCIKMQEAMAEDGFLNRAVFSNESTFHSIGKVLRHNVRVENPHAIVQHEKAAEKIFFCQRPHEHFVGLPFSVKTL